MQALAGMLGIAAGWAGTTAACGPGAPVCAVTVAPAVAIATGISSAMAAGLAVDAAAGSNTARMSSEAKFRGGSQADRDPDYIRLLRERNPNRQQRTRIHEEIAKQKKGRSNLDAEELERIFDDIMGPPR